MFLLQNIVFFLVIFCNYGFAFQLELNCSSPIVLGAILNCTTSVYDDNGHLADGKFQYLWEDDAVPHNSKLVESGPSIDTWNITYNVSANSPGTYVVRVTVCYWEFLGFYCKPVDSIGTFFEITGTLNGKITIVQSNKNRELFVSTVGIVHNNVTLKESDREFLMTAPTVLSYWFVDCIYYGITTDFQFDYNFTKPEENHIIEALVMGDFTPLPPPTTVAPSTTTIKPTTTTTKKPNSTAISAAITQNPSEKVISTTLKPANDTIKSSVSARSKRGLATSLTASPTDTNKTTNATKSNIKVWQNGTLVPYNRTFPYVCNSSFVATDKTKVYGYFLKKIKTKAPITNVTVSGNNWLRHWEVLALKVECQGSKQIQYCFIFKPGVYNVTGNETCIKYENLDKCEFPIKRYSLGSEKYTILIIIKNDVSVTITPVTVTVYKVKQQAQLSVIVVPVAFSLVAVVIIVFGVAYYLQNRSRFVVEVADFDFGQQYADMEYKTFKDRLRDSIINAFTRDPMPSTSDAPTWPPGHKYGSMT